MKKIFASTVLVATIGLVAAGCGGTTATTAKSKPAAAQSSAGPRAGGFPGGSGKVVAITGSTAQVQSQSAQVAVSWTKNTAFTKQIKINAAAVKVGSCVMVSSSQTSGQDTTASVVAATSVRITAATDGSCTMGRGNFGGFNGQRGGGQPDNHAGGQTPQGTRPTARPSGTPGFGRGAFGQITAVSPDGFTVRSARPGSTKPSTKATPTTVKVTTTKSTSYTTTAKAAAADVKIDVCVTSSGKADDTGAITASRIAVSSPVNGECGFGGAPSGQPS